METGINNSKTFILLCGKSGSGKSFAAKLIQNNWDNSQSKIHIEADDYFTDDNGTYIFDAKLAVDAHHQCINKFEQAIKDKINLIIISNVAATAKERDFYLNAARLAGYTVLSLMVENINNTVSSHDVPDQSIGRQILNLKSSFRF